MTVDPQPDLPDPRTDDDATADETNEGRSATAPAEGSAGGVEHVGGTPRDPEIPDD